MDVVLDEVINLMDAEADNVWGSCGTKRRMVGNPLDNYGGTKRNADWMMTLRLANLWGPHLLFLDVCIDRYTGKWLVHAHVINDGQKLLPNYLDFSQVNILAIWKGSDIPSQIRPMPFAPVWGCTLLEEPAPHCWKPQWICMASGNIRGGTSEQHGSQL